METYAYLFCDWTLPDMVGRFVIFVIWGYSMGKSITCSANRSWVLTFVGVLFCTLINTWMQTGYPPQNDLYVSGLYNETVGPARNDLAIYSIKVFFFYLTASVIGYRAGRQKAKKEIARLEMMQRMLNRWEAEGLIEKD